MTPYYADQWLTVWQGDCREVMAQMEPESVHCVVTSPPYWGLRDYGIDERGIGLEPTPEEYVANMVAVFREVRRVLRADGTCWVNLGGSYAAGGGSDHQRLDQLGERMGTGGGHKHSSRASGRAPLGGLKPKDLVGIPWRVAFALQADGWYLRSDIIWSKPNPMPESVTDRPTKAHEYLFLLSKSPRYYYDADAVREPDAGLDAGNGFAGRQGGARQTAVDGGEGTTERWRASKKPDGWATHNGGHGSFHKDGREAGEAGLIRGGRNLRTVWSIATQPYPGAHFATFPEKLVEPCVKAGTSERGVCPECGAPWRRQTSSEFVKLANRRPTRKAIQDGADMADVNSHEAMGFNRVTTTGWLPSCDHYPPHLRDGELMGDTRRCVPAVVLDPFAGSGTTGRVAQRLGRRAVLIDLNGEYLTQAMDRNREIPMGLTS